MQSLGESRVEDKMPLHIWQVMRGWVQLFQGILWLLVLWAPGPLPVAQKEIPFREMCLPFASSSSRTVETSKEAPSGTFGLLQSPYSLAHSPTL